jgi:hypothetical protein
MSNSEKSHGEDNNYAAVLDSKPPYSKPDVKLREDRLRIKDGQEKRLTLIWSARCGDWWCQ